VLADRIAEVPADRPIGVICQSGSRSAIAASILRAKGITNVENVTGGFTEWSRAGFPTDV
jgi:hydroxyacylglutathione hydrolase